MATLPDICPSQVRKQVDPRTLGSDFGDGYTQRGQDGLNNRLRVLTVTWANYPLVDIDTLEAFFETHEGYINFDWVPPNGTTGKWIAKPWNRSEQTFQVATLTATFQEVADL